jgi:predicted aspartyl protease
MGKAHYIEVYSDNDNDEDEEVEQSHAQGHATLGDESSQVGTKDPIMASMLGFPRFHTFRVRGFLQGHKVTILIDGGASHNFINNNMVERRGISTEEFNGFIVVI